MEVKEEPEADDEDPGLLMEVPPGVVLDKLEELLKDGRSLLRFEGASEEGWGVNGKLNGHWCSFRQEPEQTQFVDDAVWCTERAAPWAEYEKERLENLHLKAAPLPATKLPQPDARHPRKCRRTLFEYHKAVWTQRRAQGKVQVKPVAKGKAQTKAQPAAVAITTHAQAAAPFPAFLQIVRQRLLQDGQRQKYVHFLREIGRGGGYDAAVASLAGYDDLISQIPRPQGLSNGTPAAAAAPAKAKAPVAKHFVAKRPPAQPPRSELVIPEADVEGAILGPLRAASPCVATQLVRLLFGGSASSASIRLELLRHLRQPRRNATASKRCLYILRGPHGTGKSRWASKQLLAQVPDSADDATGVKRLAHICAADDFSTIFDIEEESPKWSSSQDGAADAGSNEARVQLCMELGVTPLFVDSPHLRLGEIVPYLRRAKAAQYEPMVVGPAEISTEWKSASALAARCAKRKPPRHLSVANLEAEIRSFEHMGTGPEAIAQLLSRAQQSSNGARYP